MKSKFRIYCMIIFLIIISVTSSIYAQKWLPVYRFSIGNNTAFEHLYSTNRNEVTNWSYEGIAFYVCESNIANTIPVYRLMKNSTPRLRLLTTSEVEKSAAEKNGYSFERILGYIFPSNSTTGELIYRQFKASVGDRFYTMNKNEFDINLTKGYVSESSLGRSFIAEPKLDISPNDLNLTYNSGSNSVSITSNTSWSAESNQSWLTIKNGLQGNGNAAINFDYTENATSSIREAIITFSSKVYNSKVISIKQAAKSKHLSISPAINNVTNSFGEGNLNIESNITWAASSDSEWLTISSGSSGNSNGMVSYKYTKNSSTSQRIGYITITGIGVNPEKFQLKQNGLSETLSISPSGSISIGAPSGSGSINVSSNIEWNAVSNQTWLTITSGSSGNNNGNIIYSYSENSSTEERNATITVNGKNVTSQMLNLKQSGQVAEISFNPDSNIEASFTAHEAKLIVSSNSSWEAATTDDWLTVYPAKGNAGISIISIIISENKTNADRTGYITFAINGVAKKAFEVVQKTANQIYLSFDAKGISHLSWPFYNKDISSKNPASSYNKMNDWHITEGSTYHIGKDLYAQDWNYKTGEADYGMDFYSPFSGIVIESTYNSSYGNIVVVQSDYNKKFAFLVAHLSVRSVSLNQKVKVGDKLGEIGGTPDFVSHAHCALYNNFPEPFSFSGMNQTNASRFKFDATDTGLGGGSNMYTSNCYGFTNSGSFFIARNMIEEVGGVSAKICFWDYKNSIWLEKDMIIEGDFYVFHSYDTYNDFREYCVHVFTDESETWLPTAIKELVANQDEMKANFSNNGFNFFTKPVNFIPHVACNEETYLDNNIITPEFRIYPNPTSNLLNIDLPGSSNISLVQIFDLTGNKVFSRHINSSSVLLLNELESGVYIIDLQIDDKIYYSKLIIN